MRDSTEVVVEAESGDGKEHAIDSGNMGIDDAAPGQIVVPVDKDVRSSCYVYGTVVTCADICSYDA